ncbi:MAG: glucose-1-phosphate cytidylyltransferase [Lachnospiraceae bacterium]|nr:glucose-1-phosphate cytidylyltransferase [Lachnospiraceae bacterium]
MKVVILAGGFGTRISEESYLKPKPMVEIGDAPILWHIMKYYSSFGYNDFVICCGYKGYVIKEYFADYYLHLSDITFDFTKGNEMIVHNNVAEPWKVTLVDTGLNAQTGARIYRIRKYVEDEAFMLTYGDGLSDIDLNALVKFHESKKNVVTLSAVQMGSKFGVLDFDEDDTTIKRFAEKAKEDGGWINAGFMVVESEIFDYLSDDDSLIFEQQPLQSLAEEGKLGAYKHNGFWQCMDTVRDRNILEERWKTGNAPWKIWK